MNPRKIGEINTLQFTLWLCLLPYFNDYNYKKRYCKLELCFQEMKHVIENTKYSKKNALCIPKLSTFYYAYANFLLISI